MCGNEKTKTIQRWVTVLMTVTGRKDSSKIRLSNNEDLPFYFLSCDICETSA